MLKITVVRIANEQTLNWEFGDETKKPSDTLPQTHHYSVNSYKQRFLQNAFEYIR